MALDLETAAAEDIAFYASLPDLLAAVRSRPTWTDRMARVLEYAYGERFLKLVRSGAPIEQLRELTDHLTRVLHLAERGGVDHLEKPYVTRWNMLRTLMEMRLESLRSDVPDKVLRREHVLDILRRVHDAGGLSQQQLEQLMGLKKANLSRILSMMEANELIDKRPQGQGNLILLGPRGREHFLSAPPHRPYAAAAPRAPERRGSSYLSEQTDLSFNAFTHSFLAPDTLVNNR